MPGLSSANPIWTSLKLSTPSVNMMTQTKPTAMMLVIHCATADYTIVSCPGSSRDDSGLLWIALSHSTALLAHWTRELVKA